jgi:glyoxylase-like metal-dependent hydrolase (beta-lactamase superfamily II)
MDAFRTVSKVPVKAALDTHYHFDHSSGNSFYGPNNVPVWAHPAVARRVVDTYGPMQGTEKSAVLAPLESRVKEAKSDLQRQHAQSDVTMLDHIYTLVNGNILALPNHPLDPTKFPMTIDLGGLTATIESFPGHSGTDLIVRVPDQRVVYAGDLLSAAPILIVSMSNLPFPAGVRHYEHFLPGTKTPCSFQATGRFADKMASPRFRIFSTIWRPRLKKCIKPACPPMMPPINMQFPKI